MADTIGRDHANYPVARPLLWGMLTMEIVRVDSSLSSFFGVHRRLCIKSIWRYGSQN